MSEALREIRYFAATRSAVVRAIARRHGGRVLDARELASASAAWPRSQRWGWARVRVVASDSEHAGIRAELHALRVEWVAARRSCGRPRRYTTLDGHARVVVHSTWFDVAGEVRDQHGVLRPWVGSSGGAGAPVPTPRERWEAATLPPVVRRLSKKDARAARRQPDLSPPVPME